MKVTRDDLANYFGPVRSTDGNVRPWLRSILQWSLRLVPVDPDAIHTWSIGFDSIELRGEGEVRITYKYLPNHYPHDVPLVVDFTTTELPPIPPELFHV